MPTKWGAVDPDLTANVRLHKPDLVIVSALSLAPFAAAAACPIWVDFMDVWSQFGLREATTRRGLAKLTAKLQAKLLARAESNLLAKSSIATAAGFADAGFLTQLSVGPQVTWLPTWLGEVSPLLPSGRETPVAGLIGNFDFWPNVDAYNVLVEDWLPVLVAAGYRILVAGRHTEKLAPRQHVTIVGEVQDVGEFYSMIDISLAPIRLGGGIKVKVLESLLYGRPVLGTQAAFEGMPASTLAGTVTASTSLSVDVLSSLAQATIDHDKLNPYTRAFAREVISRHVAIADGDALTEGDR
ncbi:glycosyltransferase [Microbacterium sp. SORGH_AS_0888]|uniref:glycosyltransferase n=1 Tax=Microbacterium sp. SORGH_AS_0888 TaxID=3041791 RepID=UPI00358F55EF